MPLPIDPEYLIDEKPDYKGLKCPNCGYDLTGLIRPECPECGEPFDPVELAGLQRRYGYYIVPTWLALVICFVIFIIFVTAFVLFVRLAL